VKLRFYEQPMAHTSIWNSDLVHIFLQGSTVASLWNETFGVYVKLYLYLDEYNVNARVFSVYSDASAVWSVPVHGCGTFGWYAGRSINAETLLSTGSIHEHVMLLYSIVSYSTNGSRYKHKHIRSTLCTHITCAVKIR